MYPSQVGVSVCPRMRQHLVGRTVIERHCQRFMLLRERLLHHVPPYFARKQSHTHVDTSEEVV